MAIFIIAVSTIGSVIGLAIAKHITYKTLDKLKYKYQKKMIYKDLKKAERLCNHIDYITQIDKLKSFDAHYNKNKYNKYKRKRNLNDTVIQDPILFKMSFNADYLLEINRSKINSTVNSETSKDMEERMRRVEESLRYNEDEERLNFYPTNNIIEEDNMP